MLIIRATNKLRDRLKNAPAAAPDDESTTALGDWFATALFWKPQAALLVNARTMVPVFTPLAPAGKVLDRAPEAIATVLRAHGVPDDAVTAELETMSDVRLAPTNDRQLVGVMNEFAFYDKWRMCDRMINVDVNGYRPVAADAIADLVG